MCDNVANTIFNGVTGESNREKMNQLLSSEAGRKAIHTALIANRKRKIGSNMILDMSGAENLLGKGDMLMVTESDIKRMQGLYISEDELEEFLSKL